MRSLRRRESGGVEFFRSPLLEALGFLGHAFSTRKGGVSAGRFSSLNLGGARGEDPRNVAENRRRFGEAAGFRPARLVEVRQVHGSDVLVAGEIPPGERARGDALVTNDPAVGVAIQTADCVPVLIADPPQDGGRRRACGAQGNRRRNFAQDHRTDERGVWL